MSAAGAEEGTRELSLSSVDGIDNAAPVASQAEGCRTNWRARRSWLLWMPFSPRYRHFPIPADVIAKRSPSPPALNFSPAIAHNGSADNADNGVPSMSGPTIIRDNAHAQAPHQKAQGQWPPAPRRQQRSPERYRLLCSRAVFLSHAIEAKLSLYLGMLLRETPRGRPTYT